MWAVVIAIVAYLLGGLFASTASAYYPEFVLWFIPDYAHDRRLWDVLFLDLLQFWIAVFSLAAIFAGYRWDPFGFRK